MSTAFTIAGGVIEGVGLLLVFVELAIIRSHEFGVPLLPFALARAHPHQPSRQVILATRFALLAGPRPAASSPHDHPVRERHLTGRPDNADLRCNQSRRRAIAACCARLT